jgi:hypothetical protein
MTEGPGFVLVVNGDAVNRLLLSRALERPLSRAGGEEYLEQVDHVVAAAAAVDVSCPTSLCRKWPATGRSKCPEPDARLPTPYVELAHVDEAARPAQEGLASRIRNEN